MMDTSFIIDLARGVKKVSEYLDLINRYGGALTSISYFEIFRLREKMDKKEESYFNLLFSSYPIYSFDIKAAEKAAKIWSKLRRIGRPVNPIDIMIAGIMVANGISNIITRDRDFLEILKVEDINVILI